MKRPLIDFVKGRRKALGLTQRDLADRAGVGLRFVRDLEQGKQSLRMDKVNQILALFGHRLEPAPFRIEVDDEESNKETTSPFALLSALFKDSAPGKKAPGVKPSFSRAI